MVIDDPRVIEATKISLYFHCFGGVVKGAGGAKIIENAKISLHFQSLGGVVRARAVLESLKIQRFLCTFMV